MAGFKLGPEDIETLCNDPVFMAICEACNAYREGRGPRVAQPTTGGPVGPDPDFEYFDPDELGVDPEEDAEVWY